MNLDRETLGQKYYLVTTMLTGLPHKMYMDLLFDNLSSRLTGATAPIVDKFLAPF